MKQLVKEGVRRRAPQGDDRRRTRPSTRAKKEKRPTASKARPGRRRSRGSVESPIKLPSRLELRAIDRLTPYEGNPRTHTQTQVQKIAASLREFGWTNPVLVDRAGHVIAGHGRLLAARELGMTHVPVIELSHLTDAQRRAYLLADNRLALDAGWDDYLLSQELRALDALDYELALTGFDAEEINSLLDAGQDSDPGEGGNGGGVVTCKGDLWLLEQHRLLCGDVLDDGSIRRLRSGDLQPYRTCLAVMADEEACDRIVTQWQNVTGKDAVLEGTGETFAQVAAERGIARSA